MVNVVLNLMSLIILHKLKRAGTFSPKTSQLKPGINLHKLKGVKYAVNLVAKVSQFEALYKFA